MAESHDANPTDNLWTHLGWTVSIDHNYDALVDSVLLLSVTFRSDKNLTKRLVDSVPIRLLADIDGHGGYTNNSYEHNPNQQ